MSKLSVWKWQLFYLLMILWIGDLGWVPLEPVIWLQFPEQSKKKKQSSKWENTSGVSSLCVICADSSLAKSSRTAKSIVVGWRGKLLLKCQRKVISLRPSSHCCGQLRKQFTEAPHYWGHSGLQFHALSLGISFWLPCLVMQAFRWSLLSQPKSWPQGLKRKWCRERIVQEPHVFSCNVL